MRLPVIRAFAVLLAALAGAGGTLWWVSRNAPGTRSVVDTPALLREIQSLSQLTTVRYSIQKVVGLEEKKVPVGSEKILLVVQAKVTAGIDLGEVRDIRRNGNKVRIALPPARVQDTVIDEKATKVWDRQITWWSPWVPYNPDLERQARLEALKSVRETAEEMGILREARANAERSLGALLGRLGFDVEVTGPAN